MMHGVCHFSGEYQVHLFQPPLFRFLSSRNTFCQMVSRRKSFHQMERYNREVFAIIKLRGFETKITSLPTALSGGDGDKRRTGFIHERGRATLSNIGLIALSAASVYMRVCAGASCDGPDVQGSCVTPLFFSRNNLYLMSGGLLSCGAPET